jgi:CRP-like cAMP-binding protein
VLSQTKLLNRDQQRQATPLGADTGRLAALDSRAADYVMSLADVSRLLGVCVRTVTRMVADRRLRGIRISERRRGVLASEVARFLNEGSR